MNPTTLFDNTDDVGRAYNEGYSMCSARPHHFPRNPYSEEQEQLREAWFEGADDAGRMQVYTNGIYTGEPK